MHALKLRLRGLLIEGHLEPSHALLDACATMSQLNEIRYLPPEKCTSRTHEVLHCKSPAKQLDISSETLIIKERKEVPDMSATSTLQVQEAFNRRGIAMVFADIIQHEAYARYMANLFSHLHREPPPGFNSCTVSQLIQADKQVFQLLLENNVKPKRDDTGVLPLDNAMLEALQSYHVSFALMPLPAKRDQQQTAAKKPPKQQSSPQPMVKVKTQFVKNWGDQKSKKGSGKGYKGKQRVPAVIHKLGGVANDPDGNPICFPYNCDGCDEAPDGSKCSRGLHVCEVFWTSLHPDT